jgi:DNA-binding transcriptional LysR family regulator
MHSRSGRRSGPGVEPTIYGRALLDRGLNAFDELKQAVKHIEFLADPTAGEVRVGATVVVGSSVIAAAVDRLSRQVSAFICSRPRRR